MLHDHASVVAMIAHPGVASAPEFAVIAESFQAMTDTVVSVQVQGLGGIEAGSGNSITLHSRLTTADSWFAEQSDIMLTADTRYLNFTLPPDSVISFSTRPFGLVHPSPSRPRTPLSFP